MIWKFGKKNFRSGRDSLAVKQQTFQSVLQAAADVSQTEISSFSLGNKFHSDKMHKNRNWNKW